MNILLSTEESFLFSNITLMKEKGLLYGSFGTALAMLSSGSITDERMKNSIVQVLIQAIASVLTSNDYSFEIGKLGIGCSLLFMQLNKIIDIEFDEIFKEAHYQIIEQFNTRITEEEELDFKYVLQRLIYFQMLSESKSKLSIPLINPQHIFKRYITHLGHQIHSATHSYARVELSYSIKLAVTYVLLSRCNECKKLEHVLRTYFQYIKTSGFLENNADLLSTLNYLSLHNVILKQRIIQNVKDTLNNAELYKFDFFRISSLNNLADVWHPYIHHEKKQAYSAYTSKSPSAITVMTECEPVTLMTLKGGFPRQYIYRARALKFRDVILL